MFSIHLNRLKQLWQTAGGHDRRRTHFMTSKNLKTSVQNISCTDKGRWPLGLAKARKVNQILQQLPERVLVERIELIGREKLEHRIGCHPER